MNLTIENGNEHNEFTLNEILSIAQEICKQFYKDIIPFAFIIYLPMNLFLALSPLNGVTEISLVSYKEWFATFGIMNLAINLSFLANILLSILIKDRLEQVNTTFLNIILKFYKLFVKDLKINLLMLFVVFICFNLWMYLSVTYPILFLILSVPIIFYLINWAFSIYIFTFKELDLYHSMQKSYRLVYHSWGKVFFKVAILILLSFSITIVAGLPYSFLHDTYIMKVIYSNVISVFTSFFVVAFIVFYINFEESRV